MYSHTADNVQQYSHTAGNVQQYRHTSIKTVTVTCTCTAYKHQDSHSNVHMYSHTAGNVHQYSHTAGNEIQYSHIARQYSQIARYSHIARPLETLDSGVPGPYIIDRFIGHSTFQMTGQAEDRFWVSRVRCPTKASFFALKKSVGHFFSFFFGFRGQDRG